ncbi:hypothetical protein BI364_08360 [Acidihalobacter yilgarnensis]|uniref:Calcineurin-like phosphoesterase domain-containing protein n=1 Tax=Acidihalobacter yilgarnensis TaxID=2819280 RepID=A0A1D8INC9_9GAMM|nr:hypothetical protein [Acidihalobacter yilgarnensis]AOU97976.1 hypothetical protein BI364_08360 [Acidihalobacter yilgarnensis]
MSEQPLLEQGIRPGRNCPMHYRYSASVFHRSPVLEADILYVIGGLYGNVEALNAVLAMKRLEERRGAGVTLFFNGDFNWFNVNLDDFKIINDTVLEHAAIQGNVEAELGESGHGVGCGCAYPTSTSDEVVEHSNRIMDRLRATAGHFQGLTDRLSVLPMHATVTVGDKRIGIVHGDPVSLAGWAFAVENLTPPAECKASDGDASVRLAGYLREAQVDAFCSTHTCLPVMRVLRIDDDRETVIANNGAAGMPNFQSTRYGLLTRISTRHGTPPRDSLYGVTVGNLRIDAVPIYYDHDAWLRRFTRNWGPQSPAYLSYFRRLTTGPEHVIEQAILGGVKRTFCLSTLLQDAANSGAKR